MKSLTIKFKDADFFSSLSKVSNEVYRKSITPLDLVNIENNFKCAGSKDIIDKVT